ncbi:MAG: hypothetical protein HY011_04400 [Acidobacteria bacterium]|nr:hypothetical protein [Acidobacteriota bacterium]
MQTNTSPNSVATADWTVMVYFAADNELEDAAFANLEAMKKVGSLDGKLNLLAQLDTRSSSQTFRYRLHDETTRLKEDVVETLPEINTGDPAELTAFLCWGQKNYPANHYLVVLWGHGNGWQQLTDPHRAAGLTTNSFVTHETLPAGQTLGVNLQGRLHTYPSSYHAVQQPVAEQSSAAVSVMHVPGQKVGGQPLQNFGLGILDDNTPHELAQQSLDVLSLAGLASALAAAKFPAPIDILGMDVCLMGFAELGYAVRESARFLVASEDTIALESWPYERILKHLHQHTRMSPEELSVWIVRDYLRFYSERDRDVTKAICNLTNWYGTVQALRELTQNLLDWLAQPHEKAAVLAQLVLARAYTQSFFVANYVDLYDFCYRLEMLTTKETIRSRCQAVRQALFAGAPAQPEALVFDYGFSGYRVRNARGVSVYFPLVAPAESYGTVQFGQVTGWHELLLKLDEELGDRVNGEQVAAALRGAGALTGIGAVKAGQGNPEKAGQGNPEKAGQGNPEKAGQGNPEKAGQGNPEKAGQGNPEKAGQGNPEKAGQGNPEKAGQGNPEKAGQGNPEKADQGSPERIPAPPTGLFPLPPTVEGTTTDGQCPSPQAELPASSQKAD